MNMYAVMLFCRAPACGVLAMHKWRLFVIVLLSVFLSRLSWSDWDRGVGGKNKQTHWRCRCKTLIQSNVDAIWLLFQYAVTKKSTGSNMHLELKGPVLARHLEICPRLESLLLGSEMSQRRPLNIRGVCMELQWKHVWFQRRLIGDIPVSVQCPRGLK